MASNRITEYHQQWIGYLNPIGLVFAPNALENAQVVINEGVISEQREFSALVTKAINDCFEFTGFENTNDLFLKVLNWRESDLNSDQEIITQYSFSHPQFNEVVSPTYVAKVSDEKVILIQELDQDDFDKTAATEDSWNSSPHFKFERLLREKQVSTGIIVSKKQLRLIFAPRGESSGYIDFAFKIMYQPSGRLVFSAFRELLSDAKVFNSPKGHSLIEILEQSRKYQAQVSIELSGQVLAALYELLRGFQTANDDESGKLLEIALKENPQLIYEGLLTTLLRMVFIMYAEDRNLLATDEVYQSSYSLAGLYERLRQDEAQNPDTMDNRYGAWAHLISLFRLIYDGAEYSSEKGKVILPARHGHLFDPNIYLFLEGRVSKESPYHKSPKISDGVIFRVLRNLLVLKGERISYRTLDVEQIGSVYETMMGFELSIANGETIAIKPAKSHGAPLPINLDEILGSKDKAKKLVELSELKLSDKLKKEFNECKTIEDLEQVLDKRIDRRATPFRLSKGAMVLAPSEARRKSGSHYTPRELTEPIVRQALEPLLNSLGNNPTPEQILDLKICDPAMGSGAFLVEVCRQISEKLVESWVAHKIKISISADEDELLHARRLIAQKCLYGVDRNHMAVNLAKLSLWLVTLAKDHSFSFLDHNLKHGDSLVGLTNKQIMAFDYTDRTEGLPLFQYVKDLVGEALEAREEIRNASDDKNYDAQKLIEEEYQERLEPLRLIGNLALKCFFDGSNERERISNLQHHSLVISNYFSSNTPEILIEYCKNKLKDIDFRFVPFHWELEYPEVFARVNSGFDCFIGNPPFAGKNTIISSNIKDYIVWLKAIHANTSGNSDIVAHFFRRCFNLLNDGGIFGLIATKTISQGDTRESGLAWIRSNNGCIFSAIRRKQWPGVAAVIVSIVHVIKSKTLSAVLDGKSVNEISAFLVNGSLDFDPPTLKRNAKKAFIGSYILGMGFTFDDSSDDANPILLKDELIAKNPKNAERIFPFIGYSEVANHPQHLPYRFIINFGELEEVQAREKWPDLMAIVEQKVKPARMQQNRESRARNWWRFGETTPALSLATQNLKQVLVAGSQATAQFAFAFLPNNMVFSSNLTVIATEKFAAFAMIQSRIHEIWSRFFMTTLGDTLVYTPTTCFEHFPFPLDYENSVTLESVGKSYYEYRAQLLKTMNCGLTELYNQFHSPEVMTEEISNLRKLHQDMDEAVLAVFGWEDLVLEYKFISDDSEEEDESSAPRRRALRYKYNFIPEIYDELMSRLLNLNKIIHEEEVRLGLHQR